MEVDAQKREQESWDKIAKLKAKDIERQQKSPNEIARRKAEGIHREKEARKREKKLQQDVTLRKEQLALALKSLNSSQVTPF